MPHRRVAATLALAALLGLAACAKMAPPPGGPEDKDPPVIVMDAVRPPPGAAAVARDSAVVIPFSERTDHRSVMRALKIVPPVEFSRVEWVEDTLRLVPEEGWAAERTTLVRVGGSARDRRGNELGTPFQLRFTTKAVPDSGAIAGIVWAGRELSASSRLVVLAWSADAAPPQAELGGDPSGRWPSAIVDAESGQPFLLPGLDTGLPWHVVAVIDGDDDLDGDGPGEAEASWPEPVVFPADSARVSIGEFLVGTLDSTGTIRGEVKADSARVPFVVARRAADVAELAAAADASSPDEERGEGDGGDPPVFDGWIPDAEWISDPIGGSGDFDLELPTGEVYRLGAFVDLDNDGRPGPDDPRVALDRDLSLRFVPRIDGVRFDLRGLAPWPVPADSVGKGPADSEGEADGSGPEDAGTETEGEGP